MLTRFALLASLLLPLPVAAQAVHVVTGSSATGFADIQSAVDQAANGDVVLIRPSAVPYDGFVVDGKGLTIAGELPLVLVRSDATPPAVVRNVPAGATVHLMNLELRGNTEPAASAALDVWALEAENNAGLLWVQTCRLNSFAGGLEATSCAEVALFNTTLDGQGLFCGTVQGRDGGPGLVGTGSAVDAFDCSFLGGFGCASSSGKAGDGGDGASVVGGRFFASGSILTGGFGGSTGSTVASNAGAGGDGLELSGTAPDGYTVGSTLQGGAGGSFSPFLPGPAGLDLSVLSGTYTELPGVPLGLAATNPVTEGTALNFLAFGPAGEQLFLGIADSPAALFFVPLGGPLLLGPSFSVLPLGALDASGQLAVSLPLPTLPAGMEAGRFYGQLATASATGEVRVGSAATVVLLDDSF
ncbi:MAG: hypothetical protein AAF682_22725 [Planctomycetota bacterium]